jgi:hypothetical protein
VFQKGVPGQDSRAGFQRKGLPGQEPETGFKDKMKIKITGAPGKGKKSRVPSTVAMGRVRWTGFQKT